MNQNKILRISFFVVLTIIFLFAGGWLSYRILKRPLPDYSGEVESKNIGNTIEVYRDSLAVPYIFANTDEDAAYALGYLHAQERLFQMDIQRRAGQGRLAEVLGRKALPFDEMFLTMGIERIAQEIWNQEKPETKRILSAYSNGINDFIDKNANRLSIEFDVLNYVPEKWKPFHSLIMVRLMAWELNIAWWEDLTFTHIAQLIGKEKARKIFPKWDENKNPDLPQELPAFDASALSMIQVDKDFRAFIGATGTHIGSNNWVINGSKAINGKPIIANDPHLGHQAPGKWYLANIRVGNNSRSGVTLPGLPFIVIGKNDNISWALTNIMMDDADFYVEKLNPQKTHYEVNGELKPLKIIKYTRKVKDSLDAHIEVALTHRGPIINNIHPLSAAYPAKNTAANAVSMRWTGNDVSFECYSFYLLNKAANWNDFQHAISYFAVPGQNFIYGDRSGNIGYQFGGKLPVHYEDVSGFAIDGTTSQHDWAGYLSFQDNPRFFNPDEGFIATANNKVDKAFSWYISNLWEPSSRIERIRQLLTSKSKFSVRDFKNFQNDIVSPYAAEMVPQIIAAFANVKVKDPSLKETLELLSVWNYSFEKESQPPAIYTYWFKYMLINTLKDDLGEGLFNQFCFVANVPYRVMQNLMRGTDESLFDNLNTPRIENRRDIIRKSLSDALSALESQFGRDVKQWQWGKLHKVEFQHRFAGESGIIDKMINIGPFPVHGDGTTINNAEFPFDRGDNILRTKQQSVFPNVLGPSMRYIFDFADPDQYQVTLTTGQSGNVFSPHYANWTPYWLIGEYVTIKTDATSAKTNPDLLKFSPVK